MDMQYLVSGATRFETSHNRIITTRVTRNTRKWCSSTLFLNVVCVYVVLRLNLLTPVEIITDSSDLLEISCLFHGQGTACRVLSIRQTIELADTMAL